MPTKAQLLVRNEELLKEKKANLKKIDTQDTHISDLIEEVNSSNSSELEIGLLTEKIAAFEEEIDAQNKRIEAYVKLSWFRRMIQSRDSVKSWLK